MGKDWLVIRQWGKPEDKDILCVLTTRNSILSRHPREHIEKGVYHAGLQIFKPVPGLRRYKTRCRADRKADDLNEKFSTNGYSSIREDKA